MATGRCGQGPQDERRVPHGRKAGLQAGRVFSSIVRARQLLEVVAQLGAVVVIAQALEGDDAPDDRREDRPQAVAVGKARRHPLARRRPGPGGGSGRQRGFEPLQRRIGPAKELLPARTSRVSFGEARAAERRPIVLVAQKQLADAALRGDLRAAAGGPT